MLYWGIILFICIIVCVVSLKALNKSCWDSTLYLVSTLLTGVVAVIIALAMLLTTCEYRSFLASFEAQRTIITQISQSHQFNDDTLIYVADMQNDFVTGSLGSEAAQVAAKNIAAHINEYDTVIFTRDTHGPDYLDTLEGKFLPVPHCIKDTEGWEIIPELVNGVSKVKNLYVVDKDTFGTFIWGSMSVNMSVDEDTTIEICGVCTDICVVSNALIMRAFRPNQKIECHKDWCAGTSIAAHEAALKVMESCQIEVI